MKTDAELNAELIKRFKQLTPEQKKAFNEYLQDQIRAAETGEIVISKIPQKMIIPAK